LRAIREYAGPSTASTPPRATPPVPPSLVFGRPDPGPQDAILSLVRRLRPGRRLFALAETLKACGPQEAEHLAPELLELLARHRRPEVTSTTALVFSRLPAQARSAALCVAGPALVAAAAHLDLTDPLARRSVAALAAGTADPALASRLTDLLRDADPEVVADAEHAVIDIADALAAAADPQTPAAFAAMLDAVDAYDRHRRKGVLLAALRMLGTPAGLARATTGPEAPRAAWLQDPTHPAQHAIRSLLRRSDTPEVAAAALVWLRLPTQAAACRERLLAAASVAEHESVLRWCHLMAHPARRRVMRPAPSGRLADATWSVHLPAYADLSADARRQTPRWIAALPLPADEAATMLAPLSADPDPLVRAALLVHSPGAGPDELADLAYDDDASVARMAAVRLAQRAAARPTWRRAPAGAQEPPPAERALTRLLRSPHPQVRAFALAAAPDEHSPPARAAWRSALRRDPTATLAELRDRLFMGPSADRVRWVGTVRRLGVCDKLERDLCDIAEDVAPSSRTAGARPDPVLAASAIAALGECPGARAASILDHALASSDPRIVSNAIEALTRRARAVPHPSLPDRLLAFRDAVEHRPRATAALAAARIAPDAAAPAGAVLLEMLADPRPAHRVAGVWLAERAAAIAGIDAPRVLARIHLLHDDPDPGVRARADRCAHRLAHTATQEVA
jgi:hypothetical protein